MTLKHPSLPGAELLYDGRTLHLTVLVNTDEPLNDVAARIQAAAKGPNQVMAAVMGAECKPAGEAKALWQGIWDKVDAAKQPKPEGGS